MYLSSDQIYQKTAKLLIQNRVSEEDILKVVYPSRYESTWSSFKSFPEEYKKIVGVDFTVFFNSGKPEFLWTPVKTSLKSQKKSKNSGLV